MKQILMSRRRPPHHHIQEEPTPLSIQDHREPEQIITKSGIHKYMR
jgi:hypothetical protein